MVIEILAILYFVFFFLTNTMFFNICYKVMDRARFSKKVLYAVALFNAIVFTIIAYGFNQLPTVTYLMVLIGSTIELLILFKNNIFGILMYSFMVTIHLVCIESIVISSGALIFGLTIGDITHNHDLLFQHIVTAWAVFMLYCHLINRFLPGKYLKIINQQREQTLFILGFLFATTAYLTLNSFIYANADNFDPLYLPIHQLVTPLCWLVVVNLAVALMIRFDVLHGYKVKNIKLQKTIDRQQSELEESKHRAERDALVNVYNKAATEQKIKEALLEVDAGAFFILDIDDFKGINDTKGHPFGDKVLIYLSRRIENTFRGQDIVGRIGGDEFVVFLRNTSSEVIIKSKAEELCREMSIPFADESGNNVSVSISIGIALMPKHGKDFDTLYSCADRALYRSKELGKNTYTICTGN